MRQVYLDHAATTPMDPRVREAMEPYFAAEFANPSAIYAGGRRIREAIDNARLGIARIFNCMIDEVVFTGSGTESDNMAVIGVARAYNRLPAAHYKHIVTSTIEHHAVLRAAEYLEKKEGFSVTYLKPDKFGMTHPDAIRDAITRETVVVSILYANNEIGTINPIHEIAKVVREKKQEWGRKQNEPPFFHTDACQASGYLDLDVKKLGVDLMAINGSKIYGPKGTGALFVRRGVRVEPLIHGGGQENKLRSGTENVAGIMGFAKALDIAHEERVVESARLIPLREKLIRELQARIPKVVLNGHPTERLPNNVNVSILDIEGEAMLLYLDHHGISASTGSACDSASLEPSHVILGIGRPYEYAHASMRFTMGRSTTEADIDYLIDVLPKVVNILRRISPVRLEVEDEAKIGTQADEKMASAFVGARPHWESKK